MNPTCNARCCKAFGVALTRTPQHAAPGQGGRMPCGASQEETRRLGPAWHCKSRRDYSVGIGLAPCAIHVHGAAPHGQPHVPYGTCWARKANNFFPPFSSLMVNLNGLDKHALVSPCALHFFLVYWAPRQRALCHLARWAATGPLAERRWRLNNFLKLSETRRGALCARCGLCRGVSKLISTRLLILRGQNIKSCHSYALAICWGPIWPRIWALGRGLGPYAPTIKLRTLDVVAKHLMRVHPRVL